MDSDELGHFSLLEKIGVGGMGRVYKARDKRLARFVAIKLLSEARRADADRRARFVQEAKAASALNHPNIITIHEVGEQDGQTFIVMELVDGKPLNELIPRKGMRLTEALRIAAQVADALTSAHAAGIVHRDLKPANIMVDAHGRVKVLDFGLAKLFATTASATAAADESTKTVAMDQPATEEGVILGSIPYMSPEQAEGRPVDARSDIFSFGAVLYEMITGQRAFRGESRASTLAAVVEKDPQPPSESSSTTPPELDRLVARCLRKDINRRSQNMADVKLALEELKEESETGKLQAPSLLAPRRTRQWMLPVFALLVSAIAAAGWWLARVPKQAMAPTLTRLTSDAGLTTEPALSPDGKLLAYASDRGGEGNLDIWVQQVAGGEAIRLTRDPADDREPAFSADGSQIAFRSDREGGGIYLIPALGGEARLIVKGGNRPQFSPDGKWIAYWAGHRGTGDPFAPGSAHSFVISTAGGAPRQLRPDFAVTRNPIWAPDGRHLLVEGKRSAQAKELDDRDLWVTPLEDGPAVATGALETFRSLPYSRRSGSGAWLPDGRVVFSAVLGDGGDLWEVIIKPGTWKVTGVPRRITTGTGLSELPSFASARAGGSESRMAFAGLTYNLQIWSLPLPAKGGRATRELRQVTDNPTSTEFGSLSADGTRLVFVRARAGVEHIWMKDIPTGRETDLTPGPAEAFHPRISADGSMVVYNELKERRSFLYTLKISVGTDGTARPNETGKVCEDCQWPWQWTPDGTRILYSPSLSAPRTIGVWTPETGERLELLRHPQANLYQANASPDGRWVAFLAASQIQTLYIAPLRRAPPPAPDATPGDWIPVTGDEFRVDKPRWSPDGNLLYFTSDRDTFRCLWGQRLDPQTMRPVGPPMAVYHFHQARRSLTNVGLAVLEPAVARDKIVFNLAETTGNIWLAEWSGR
jgi:Tol biopolymer transport system component/tRNA A-37 threonylcarbamoyl transferase component Bud32